MYVYINVVADLYEDSYSSISYEYNYRKPQPVRQLRMAVHCYYMYVYINAIADLYEDSYGCPLV